MMLPKIEERTPNPNPKIAIINVISCIKLLKSIQ